VASTSAALAVVENLRDSEVSNSWDLSQLFAHVLAGLEAGQEIPDDLVTLMRGHVGSLARMCGRDEFAEKYGLLALQDGHLSAAEKWSAMRSPAPPPTSSRATRC
jgi:hypothetical protein